MMRYYNIYVVSKLFDAEVVKKEATPNLRLLKHLQSEARNSHYLVLWLDCDKEGENICFEILDAIADVFPISFDQHRQVRLLFFRYYTLTTVSRPYSELNSVPSLKKK